MIPESVSTLGPQGTQGQQSANDAFQDLDMQTFIKLLVVQMSSQDPLEPMDNSQILQQISQIREIAATDQLTSSLDAIKLGQNMATAAGLIDQTIDALTDEGQRIVGKVDKVSIEFGVPKLHVGDYVIDMRNIGGIAANADDLGMIELAVGTAASAASLIGQTIEAVTDDGDEITGKVDWVSVESGVPKLHVGEQVLDMRNVVGFTPDAEDNEPDDEQGDDTQDTAN